MHALILNVTVLADLKTNAINDMDMWLVSCICGFKRLKNMVCDKKLGTEGGFLILKIHLAVVLISE